MEENPAFAEEPEDKCVDGRAEKQEPEQTCKDIASEEPTPRYQSVEQFHCGLIEQDRCIKTGPPAIPMRKEPQEAEDRCLGQEGCPAQAEETTR